MSPNKEGAGDEPRRLVPHRSSTHRQPPPVLRHELPALNRAGGELGQLWAAVQELGDAVGQRPRAHRVEVDGLDGIGDGVVVGVARA